MLYWKIANHTTLVLPTPSRWPEHPSPMEPEPGFKSLKTRCSRRTITGVCATLSELALDNVAIARPDEDLPVMDGVGGEASIGSDIKD